MLYSITYELKNLNKDYSDFIQKIKELSSSSSQCMKNSWFINSSMSKDDLYRDLKQHLEDSDLLLIVETSLSQMAGWLPSDTVDWLKEK